MAGSGTRGENRTLPLHSLRGRKEVGQRIPYKRCDVIRASRSSVEDLTSVPQLDLIWRESLRK